MRRWILLAVVAVTGCDKKEPPAPAAADGPPRVKVRHILVGWSGAPKSKSSLSRAEAEKKAQQLLERAKNGDDFARMIQRESEDPGGGVYTMVNRGAKPAPGEKGRDEMVKGFSDAAFRMKVGEFVLVPYDAAASPYGWHVIHRME